MLKRSVTNSRQADKPRSTRLGFGSYELPSTDSYSHQKVRADFFRVLDILEPDVANTLYKKAFFQFVLLAWNEFPEAIPAPLLEWHEDENFLLELERVTKDFSALPYNPVTNSFHPVFIELLAPRFSQDQELVKNHLREVLMIEILRPFEELEDSLPRVFANWIALQNIEDSAPLCKTLIDWSQDWNLDEDWCRDYAVATLCHWLSDRGSRLGERSLSLRRGIGEVLTRTIWTAHMDTIFPVDERGADLQSLIGNISADSHFHFCWREIDFQTPRWNPIMSYRDEWMRESEKEFIAYLTLHRANGGSVLTGTLNRFRKARNEYLRKVERAALRAGLIKTPRRWADEHLSWAVRFQAQKWSLSKIEETYSKPRKTIADGINRTLDFIALTRRPDLQHGMPKGTSLSSKRRIVRN
jgi:hypothetical protein